MVFHHSNRKTVAKTQVILTKNGEISELNDTKDQMDLTDIYRTSYSNTAEYMFARVQSIP